MRRKTIKTVLLILLILVLSALPALLTYLYFFSSNKELSGEWTTEVDMTGQAAVAALLWLQDIEAVSVTLEDVEARMERLTVEVNMTLEQTDRSGGTFRCRVVPESYEDCNQAAYEAFAEIFRELTAERLRMAGYTGAADEEAVEALAAETFGMSTVSYLMTCGPALLPPLEELQDRYDGNGTYVAEEGILTRQYEEGATARIRAERYSRNETGLILTEKVDHENPDNGNDYGSYPVIYVLRQEP